MLHRGFMDIFIGLGLGHKKLVVNFKVTKINASSKCHRSTHMPNKFRITKKSINLKK